MFKFTKNFTFTKIILLISVVFFSMILLISLFESIQSNYINNKTKNKIVINRLKFNQDPKNYNVKLQIIDNEKEITSFNVIIADSNREKTQGLMFLENMPTNHGMLFLFDKNQIITMWMKNTIIPLDMIFIDENDIIANIVTNTKPYSLDIISSNVKVNRVLEINAGLVEKLRIKVGQKVLIPNLKIQTKPIIEPIDEKIDLN